jgi:hypothetical protein
VPEQLGEGRSDLENQYHHFLPQSYLSGWCGADHKLSRYRREQNGKISHRRYGTKNVGGRNNLYALNGVALDRKQVLEREIFQRIDNEVQPALKFFQEKSGLIEGGPRGEWALFLVSIMHRSQEAVESYNTLFEDSWMDEAIAKVKREPELGLTPEQVVEHYRTTEPFAAYNHSQLVVITKFLENPDIERLPNLQWEVLDFATLDNSLMTSDCPLMISRTESGTIIWLSIALNPNSMFVAYVDLTARAEVLGEGLDDLAERYNGHIVSRSCQLVFAYDARFRDEVGEMMSDQTWRY